MSRERDEAAAALMRAIAQRLAKSPLVDRRMADRRDANPGRQIEAVAASGPVDLECSYWVSSRN